jgi:ABC-2 type transport system ATP-binding protein
MKSDSATILANNLVKKFGGFTAVDQVTFEVRRGEIFGFLGPNGSGKTTTIRMMLGLIPPTSGEVEVLGIPVIGQTMNILPRIGYMSQHFSLYNDLSVHQNLSFYGQAYGINPSEMENKIKKAISMAGLAGYEDTTTRDLSGGWRQRLALSAAIIHRPEVLFLDEPTAGVDPVSRREFWDLLYRLVEEGITVFITTHYMDEAEHCHRLAFIQRGRIISRGSPLEIKEKTISNDVLEIQTSNPQRLLKTINEGIKTKETTQPRAELYGSVIHIITPNSENTKQEIENTAKSIDIEIDSMTVVEPTLEDVFIASMQEE